MKQKKILACNESYTNPGKKIRKYVYVCIRNENVQSLEETEERKNIIKKISKG